MAGPCSSGGLSSLQDASSSCEHLRSTHEGAHLVGTWDQDRKMQSYTLGFCSSAMLDRATLWQQCWFAGELWLRSGRQSLPVLQPGDPGGLSCSSELRPERRAGVDHWPGSEVSLPRNQRHEPLTQNCRLVWTI